MKKALPARLLLAASLALASFTAGFVFTPASSAACDPGTIGNCTDLSIVDQWCAWGCVCSGPNNCCQTTMYECSYPTRGFYTARDCRDFCNTFV